MTDTTEHTTAWHNDPSLTSQYRGCAIGCTLPKQDRGKDPAAGWHAEVERLYGIPRPLGFLIDRCFEGLPADRAGDFAVAAVSAVPVGADLTLVTSRLMLDVLVDPERGVLRFTKSSSAQRDAVEAVAGLYRRRLAGDEPTRDEWVVARRAAAVAYAAYAAYAADAADAADAAYAAAAARREQWAWTADRLIHHIAAAPIRVAS